MALMIAANYHLPAGIDRFTFGGELQQDNAGEILLGKLIIRDMSLYKDLVLKGSMVQQKHILTASGHQLISLLLLEFLP